MPESDAVHWREYVDLRVDALRDHVDTVSAAAKEQVALALASQKEAAAITAVNVEAWRKSQNEWRAAMSDKDRLLPTRVEVEQGHLTLAARIEALEKLNEREAGGRAGVRTSASVIVGGVGLLLSLLLIASTALIITSR